MGTGEKEKKARPYKKKDRKKKIYNLH